VLSDPVHPSSLTDVVELLERERDEARAEVVKLRASLAAAQASAARLLSVARRLAEDERQTRGDE
jgi:hypothetical protein